MSLILNGTDGVTFNDTSLQGAAASPYGLKNRIINGDMVIDQRNAGASVTPTDGQFAVDRWRCRLSQSSKYSFQQNAAAVTPPTGFNYYLGATSLSSFSPASGDFFNFNQPIEGYNIADLAWGTANAKTVTLSFQVYSSLTGLFGARLLNASNNRYYIFTYTVSSANTWTTISVTIDGDTTGTWGTTNGIGISLAFDLGSGSTFDTASPNNWGTSDAIRTSSCVRVIATNGATFYITGVQLEVGSTATPFERRLYNQELANCQRYYNRFISTGASMNRVGSGLVGSATTGGVCFSAVTMRATPTGNYLNGALSDASVNATLTAVNTLNAYGSQIGAEYAASGGGLTTGRACNIRLGNTGDYVDFSAEL